MNETRIEFIALLLSIAFAAGAYALRVREHQRQIRALWNRFGQLKSRERHHNTQTLMLISRIVGEQPTALSVDLRRMLDAATEENGRGSDKDGEDESNEV